MLGCTQAKITYLEMGRNQQKPDEVTALLRFYGADVEHVDRMASLAARADQGTWWAHFSGAVPQWFKTFIGLEGLAAAEFTYEPLVLPGQLQTPEYAMAMLDGNIRVPPMEAAQVVRARMARQRLTDDTNPLRFSAVLEEYVLQRMVGGPAVMRAQLEHLLVLAQRDNVDLLVMPASVAVHDGLDGDFMLLDFDEAQSIGYIEYPTGALYLQEPEQIAVYQLSAERLRAAALSASDSADLISAHISELTTMMEG
ncbi:Cro/Cl family transcriptional regulator [Pseudonocardia sp. CNS-139]|nr:Cro/Cl family transcriptional regulator [Pseudonocardia sp. CNS-139]